MRFFSSSATFRDVSEDIVGVPLSLVPRRLFIAPTLRRGKAATKTDFLRGSKRLDHVLGALGLKRHPRKRVWGKGTQELNHLGFHLSTLTGLFMGKEKKRVRMKRVPGRLLGQASQGHGVVLAAMLASFFVMTVSLILVVLLARVYARYVKNCLTY